MAELTLKSGQTVQSQDGREGIIRYIGPLHIAAGDWLGLELPDSTGKNDGSVKGERYFECQPGHGIFVRKESIVHILQQPTVSATPNPIASTASNGVPKKPRPPSGTTAEVARKRQSVMSASSASTPASRLSLRSPTKSPTAAPNASAKLPGSRARMSTSTSSTQPVASNNGARPGISTRKSMAPPATSTKASSHVARPSLSGIVTKPPSKSSTTLSRQPGSASRMSLSTRPEPRSSVNSESKLAIAAVSSRSSPVLEEEDQALSPDNTLEHFSKQIIEEPQESSQAAEPGIDLPVLSRARTNSVSQATSGTVDARTAARKEIEQLKATIRTLEKKVNESGEKVRSVDQIQAEKDRFEGIIQALQKKLRSNQQELQDLKLSQVEKETQARKAPDRSAEHESEIELATLDKEMAEERAEIYHAELEALKTRHEELELEAEILREENRELGSVMSPEERANAGWLQMERERERLRQALILLRDVSQQTETELRAEVKDLNDTLEDADKVASMLDETAEKLAKSEEINRHLKEQLEAAEANDEVFEAMEARREQDVTTIEQLRRQIQDFEEHIQVTDELESFHIEEEKRLHTHIDESEALMNEKHRQLLDQEKVVENLEYTLSKFREVVQGLQGDIDELQRSRDMNEHESREMSSRSRAVMDLNLQLQNNAAKTQLKAIDLDMETISVEQARLQLEIVQLFVPETFESEKAQVQTLLCFKRVMAKALLVRNVLHDRMRDRPHLVRDDPFAVCETVEKMAWIGLTCSRFVTFLYSCSAENFAKFAGGVTELEPVERAVDGWIDALRRDELGSEGPQQLTRILSILVDMSDKLIEETNESRATELVVHVSLAGSYFESATNQLILLTKLIQSRLGSGTDEDCDELKFEKGMDQFCTKTRTLKYLCNKTADLLRDLRSRSMCLEESSWVFFEDFGNSAQNFCTLIRAAGRAVVDELGEYNHDQEGDFISVINILSRQAQAHVRVQNGIAPNDNFFDIIAKHLHSFQRKIDDLGNKASDTSTIVEYESLPTPWTVQARAIKAERLSSQDTQKELEHMKSRVQELALRLIEKDNLLEEQQIRIDLLESRSKETRVRDENVKAIREELDKLYLERSDTNEQLARLESEARATTQSYERVKADYETFKASALTQKGATFSGVVDDLTVRHFKTQIDMLNLEITSLSSAVRYLKQENHRLRVPVEELAVTAREHSWLDVSSLRQATPLQDVRRNAVRREGAHVYATLINLAQTMKPVVLKSPATTKSGSPVSIEASNQLMLGRKSVAAKHIMSMQRIDFENWLGSRNDFVRHTRVMARNHDILMTSKTEITKARMHLL